MPDFEVSEEFLAALTAFDFTSVQAFENEAEALRVETLKRYPPEIWEGMTLEQYAEGQDGNPENFCRWMEFQTQAMGSIGGGSAHKLIISKKKNDPGWRFPANYSSVEEAWVAVRRGFQRATELAQAGDWAEIDLIPAIQPGQALYTKLLYVYHPTDVIPINSDRALRHFLQVLGDSEIEDEQIGRLTLNQRLLASLRSLEEVPKDISTKALERFLFRNFSPLGGRVFKIAPGPDAMYWGDCLEGGYICVGWDEVGDLTQFESKESFRQTFGAVHDYSTPQKETEKANELWTLLELEEGDRIVANRGIDEVLAIGRVVAPGYAWNEERPEYRHTVRVEWDPSQARTISPRRGWGLRTVKELRGAELRSALGRTQEGDKLDPDVAAADTREVAALREALLNKGQVVLYGPPGTGKTRLARLLSDAWLESDASSSAPPSPAPSSSAINAWLVVANKKQDFEWGQLFPDGEQVFSRGRAKSNYASIQAGDVVFGYEAHPTKRITALARVKRIESPASGRTFVVEGIARLTEGPTWQGLKEDSVLAQSQPVINGAQGTLFRLSTAEWSRLAELISETDAAGYEKAVDENLMPDVETETDEVDIVEWITFHPAYSYEDFVEGFRPSSQDGPVQLRLESGVFKRVCLEATSFPDRNYLIVIDEINRANVASVFGELITLIESDKRGSFSARLPYSREPFVVPRNVFLLGTMNTADRSIRLMDTALRRRFGFYELMPDPTVVSEGSVEGLPLDQLLSNLNERIRTLIGREKQLGHSFFLKGGEPISVADDLARAFREEVIPLIQEYAMDDWYVLAQCLGSKVVDSEGMCLRSETVDDAGELVGALMEEFGGAVEDS